MPRLLIIIASVREGRAGGPVGDWFVDRTRAHGEFDVEAVDLKELALPMMDEPNHPRLGRPTARAAADPTRLQRPSPIDRAPDLRPIGRRFGMANWPIAWLCGISS